MLHKLSRNTFILLTNNVGTAILSFGLTVVVARGLGQDGLGQYATIMAWIFPLTLLADFGISTLITRDVAQNHQLAAAYVHQALRVRWFWGGGLVTMFWILAPYLSNNVAIVQGLRIGIFLSLIDSIFGIYTAVWRARENMLPILILNIALLTMQVIGVGIAVAMDGDIRDVFLVLVLADVLQLGATWVIWRNLTPPQPLPVNREGLSVVGDSPSPQAGMGLGDGVKKISLFTFMRQAGQFAIAGLLAAIQARMIFLLLEHFTSTGMVGWFAAASRFIEAGKIPIFALFGAVFPAMSALVHEPARLRQTFRRMNMALGAYAVAVALILTFLGGFIIKLAFGDEFSGAAPILVILAWGLIPLLLRQNMTLFYYAQHQERIVNQITLGIVAVQLLLGIILIQAEAGRGAAWTIFLSEGLFLWLLLLGKPRLVWLLPLLIILVGLAARLEILRSIDFDGLYGQDAFAYFDYGVEVKQSLAELRFPAAMYWGLGFPVTLAAGFILNGVSAEAAQLLVLLTGALTGGITYLLIHDGLRLVGWSRREAIIAGSVAGLLVTFSGQLLQSSLVVMADAPGLFWATLSAWCVVRYALACPSRQGVLTPWNLTRDFSLKGLKPPVWVWLMLASITLALAGMTRWIFFLLAIPWAICCLQVWDWRLRWRDAGLAVIAGGVLVLIQFAHSSQNPDALVGHSWLEGWSPKNALQRDFVNPDGTFHYAEPVAEFYIRAAWDGFYAHPIFLPLMIFGAFVLMRRFRENTFVIILLLGWFAVTYGFLTGIPYQNIRFSLAFFPPLAGLAGIGLAGLWRILDRVPAIGWAAQGLTILAIGVALTTTYQAGEREVERFATIKTADLSAVEWARQEIPEANAAVYTLELWLMMQHYAPDLNALQIYYETPDTLAGHSFSERPTYLLLNLWAIENQWIGKAPYLAYHWINEHVGLTYLGRHGNYHLWRVNT